ncbi:hypothetical protein [Gottfriedia luciferensis]|uniref:hypothetical protein n=1 Tax=Gottfriedia luciferensis TaxID=178774 RepID=UPI000B450ABB|nr:hypothetical protein [Gottfriedia luciferensis]
MRHYIKVSKREVEGLTIYCAIFFGNDGQLCDCICGSFETEDIFFEGVETIVQYHGFYNYEVASDIISYLHHYRGMPGITVHYIYEMPEIDDLVKQELPLLRELYEFPPIIPKRKPSKFNAWIYRVLKNKITNLEEMFEYEI